ncbi:MAG: CRISPR-associated helicase Cas3' [Thermomicrobiales bacterium]|nr:CRISPR-associated helicase Cas3' [Thermomicrobiales bacterium]
MPIAHSRNASGERHDLSAHLGAVADLAAIFARPFGGDRIARAAGQVHDIGKASDAFQRYLEACEREPRRRHPTVDHKGAGTLVGFARFAPLALLIQGHHGGLPDCSAVKAKVRALGVDDVIAETLRRVTAAGLALPDRLEADAVPSFAHSPLGAELFLRMCFSALVDADHLDTERHFSPERADQRGATPDIATLGARLIADQASLTGGTGPVNAVRDEVYRACLAAAAWKPGFFRLTVPTGGGKTRSALAFALEHARAHGLQRVIVAVPYLTITDQTAQTFRDIFPEDRSVLEHFSSAGSDDAEGGETTGDLWRRLAAQDWDAPIVVTTTVQFFESLFGRTPTACRKLHRIAESVVILDEAQTLPQPLLAPILDALSQLTAHYRTSVVLCTATQPAFARAPGFSQLANIREIAPDPPRLFQTLKRVDYVWPEGSPWSWQRVADEMRSAPQALAIVNTKAAALALLDALADPDASHLSTLLCGAHRRDVLAEVRDRLRRGQPCRVVSTQVVEAGVDVDFPLVLRAMGPLDRIVQAAGRCNREGRLERGRTVVFEPEEDAMPAGPYRIATQITQQLLAAGACDPDDPALFERYFAKLFASVDVDARTIQDARAALKYETVARDFRMIDDDGVSVVVAYGGSPHLPGSASHAEKSAEAITNLRAAGAKLDFSRKRVLFAAVQPYVVSLRRRAFNDAQRSGLVAELAGGMWEWMGEYDPVRGLVMQGDLDRLVF